MYGYFNALEGNSQRAGTSGALLPANTVLPVITGTLDVGQVLTCSTGTWTNSPSGYTYQWNRDGVAIPGATSSTYTTVTADATTTITCTVTATNASGTGDATSAGVVINATVEEPTNGMVWDADYMLWDTPYMVWN